MSILEKKVRLTTLRDLGAFQVDALDTQKIESTNIILEKKVRLTTLRDFGAFQVDAFDTQKVAAIDAFDTQKIESTNIKAFPSREATDSLVSSKAKLEGATAIIPFSTSSTPLKERQRQKVDYQQRATTIVEKAKKKKRVKFAARVPGFQKKSGARRIVLTVELLGLCLLFLSAGIVVVLSLAPYPLYCIEALIVLAVVFSHVVSLSFKSLYPKRQKAAARQNMAHLLLIKEDTMTYLRALRKKTVTTQVP